MLRFSRKLIAVLFAFSSLAAAQQMRSDRPQIFPLEEVRAGMKGVGRTVFSGSEPAEFGVEILGVLPNYPGPRQSVIIARLFGPQVEKTGV
ncbi:MAG: hypothetical protein IRZ19_06725, partial [Pyrinomonas methylaliphatogenes]|nr:hypothetical protein [Pyrinomonas methylaliphatogenes]